MCPLQKLYSARITREQLPLQIYNLRAHRIMPRTLVTFFFFVLCLWPLGDWHPGCRRERCFFRSRKLRPSAAQRPQSRQKPDRLDRMHRKVSSGLSQGAQRPLGASQPLQQRDALHGPRAAVRQRVRQKSRHRSVRTAPEKISRQRLPRTGCRRAAETERTRPPQERKARQGARRQDGAGRQGQGGG